MLLIQNKILLSYFNNNSNLTSLIKYSYLNIKVNNSYLLNFFNITF